MASFKQYYVNNMLPLPSDYYTRSRILKLYGTQLKEYYVHDNIYMVNTRTIDNILLNMRWIEKKMEEESVDKYLYMPFTNMYEITRVNDITFRVELMKHCFTKAPYFIIKKVEFREGNWYKCPDDILKIIGEEEKTFIYHGVKMRYSNNTFEIVNTGEKVEMLVV